MGNEFDPIDRIVCITLRDRPDRRRFAERVHRRLGISDRVEFFVADRHELGGKVGCFDSHVRVVSGCLLDPRCRSVLVFEDDAVPTPGYDAEKLGDALEWAFKHVDAWDVFFVGHVPVGKSFLESSRPFASLVNDASDLLLAEQAFPGVVWNSALGAHAYVLNRRSMSVVARLGKQMLLSSWTSGHYDVFLRDVLPKSLCTSPVMLDQKWCLTTDNDYSGEAGLLKNVDVMDRLRCGLEKVHGIYALSLVREHPYAIAITLAIVLAAVVATLVHLTRAHFPKSRRT